MKTKLLLAIILLFSISCSKNEIGKEQILKDKFIGTWVETNPDLYDGISDTIIFNEKSLVEKHFYFDGWNYTIYADSIFFQKDETIKKFLYSIEKENEMVIYNFIDRLITNQVKNIQFTKIK
ncbi:MAG: hypothetical protein BWX65_00709 [Bacteroidetes bacterium ADurb.Bin057]|jgi:hypothetical protein|nr:MAG: hypothetical protein BWX65_00709 [Bacteroidetes bacterium ADurb.Bin057]HOA46504.1 hypothetical protein [Paludibacteraceae bacterium]HOH71676.1 hypothetical protein [Paludibacteraceae bacterium]